MNIDRIIPTTPNGYAAAYPIAITFSAAGSPMACWAAASPGVFVTAPDIIPTSALIDVFPPSIKNIARTIITFSAIAETASILSLIPPSLNEEKKPGPTCKPIAKMKIISPNSLINFNTWSFTSYPKCPIIIPTKRTNVTPNDTPPILSLPK